jgi:hypothetical protein
VPDLRGAGESIARGSYAASAENVSGRALTYPPGTRDIFDVAAGSLWLM